MKQGIDYILHMKKKKDNNNTKHKNNKTENKKIKGRKVLWMIKI